jgi:hypothetical protein
MVKLTRIVGLLAILTGTATPALAQNDAVGSWDLTTISPEGTFSSEVFIKEDDGKLVALGRNEGNEQEFDSIEVAGNAITLVITIKYKGVALTITYKGELQKDKMSGDASFGGFATGTWSAARKAG